MIRLAKLVRHGVWAGVIKGVCGPSCACCYSGCPRKWRGDGECDFECNMEQYGWDGGDCRGSAPVFSECPDAWKGDGSCDGAIATALPSQTANGA